MESRHRLGLSPIIACGLLLASCTHIFEIPITRVEHPPTEKFDLRVGLRLTEDLRNAKAQVSVGGDTDVVPLGPLLAENSEILMRALFADVVVIDEDHLAPGAAVDALITPEVVEATRNRPVWKREQQRTFVALQWTVTDRAGRVVWIETIEGEGKGPTGIGSGPSMRERGAQAQAQKLAINLFSASFEAIRGSSEIRRFEENTAIRRRAPAAGRPDQSCCTGRCPISRKLRVEARRSRGGGERRQDVASETACFRSVGSGLAALR